MREHIVSLEFAPLHVDSYDIHLQADFCRGTKIDTLSILSAGGGWSLLRGALPQSRRGIQRRREISRLGRTYVSLVGVGRYDLTRAYRNPLKRE